MQVCIKRHMNRNRYSECWVIKKIYYDVVISTNCSIQINCQTIINTLSSMHIKIITLNLYFVVTLNQLWCSQPSTFSGCYWWFLGDIFSSQIPVVIELVAEIGGWINSSLSPIQAHGVQNHVWHNINISKCKQLIVWDSRRPSGSWSFLDIL